VNKTFTFLIIAIVIAVAGFFFWKNPSFKPVSNLSNSGVDTKQTALKISPIIKENATTTYTVINLSYPQSSNTKNPELYDYVQKTKNDFVEEYGHLTKAEADKMYMRVGEPFELYISTKIATSTNTVSYILETYHYTGGAHGGTDVNTFTYDNLGHLVEIDDVLTSGWLKEIATMSKTYFYNTLGDNSQPSMIDDGTEPIPENFSAWYLSGDSIVFIFGQYQVGPYVLGIQEYKINKSQIPELLQPAYK
jgi:hypothetical protein